MLRTFLCLGWAWALAWTQSPDGFFHSAGAGYRNTAEEQQLYWRPHIENSYRRILEASERVERESVATVLAAGVCSEIPLEELARRYDRVILADMDGASMVTAVQSLPLRLRGKVELRVTDVTTFAGPLMERIHAAIESSENALEAFGRLEAIFSDLQPGEIPSRLPQSDLVVSSLVVSELHRYPLAYADRLLRTRFQTRLRDWKGSDQARARLQRLVIEDHVALLASICRPGGRIYYGDTVARGPAYDRFPAGVRGEVEASILPDFRRLGLADSASEVTTAVHRFCHADFGIRREVEAFETLLAAYERRPEETFEPLVPLGQIQREWTKQGLTVDGQPESWWWLEYPCSISHSPGGFRITSWILRPGAND